MWELSSLWRAFDVCLMWFYGFSCPFLILFLHFSVTISYRLCNDLISSELKIWLECRSTCGALRRSDATSSKEWKRSHCHKTRSHSGKSCCNKEEVARYFAENSCICLRYHTKPSAEARVHSPRSLQMTLLRTKWGTQHNDVSLEISHFSNSISSSFLSEELSIDQSESSLEQDFYFLVWSDLAAQQYCLTER